jgi:hypothetical protein
MGGKRHKRNRTRKMRGGMGYGFGGAMGTNGPVWDASWGGEVTKSGTPVYDTADPQRGSSRRRKRRGGADEDLVEVILSTNLTDEATARAVGATGTVTRKEAEEKGYKILGPAKSGGRSRRKSKKAKKSRKTRKMRGGASWLSVAPVGYGYTGSGSRGLADATGYASKVPPSGGPAQNADGAYRA